MAKILFIVNSLNPGGAERHVVSLVNHLDADEFPRALAYLHSGDALRGEIAAEYLESTISCGVRQKLDLQVVRRLAGHIDREGVEVVYCTNLYSMLYGVLARARSKRRPRLVMAFHTTLLGSWRLRFQMAFYWLLFRQCDELIYVCQNQRRHWRRRGLRARADSFIYNGVDVDRFSVAVVRDAAREARNRFDAVDTDLMIGICAGLRPEKAHGDLLEAVALLKRDGVPARCLVIGDGPERPRIERRIAELGLQEQAFVVGFQADVRPWVAACDVMAIVSHAVETFSISALEAMALERPMVMSRIGGADEQVTDGHNGYVYEAGDIGALAACLKKFADPAERRRQGANAREVVVKRFELHDMVRRYEDALRSVAGRS
ncbi:MAG: glycosyltransferase [Betaproteobacteria bacterium]|nr:glycosyltransferase [Betaproteobacteria bacterium]